jgi:protein gp37
MNAATGISWTDRTWNPVVGCTKVSQGCKNCYAKTLHDRRHKAYKAGKLRKVPQYAQPFETVQLINDRISLPLRWRKPARVFVNSLSDLFHDDVPDAFILDVFSTMAQASHHTFQVLTKRPERMLRWFTEYLPDACSGERPAPTWPLPNVWLGVSVENQAAADQRISLLLETPAAVRFLSCEPLLGPVDLNKVLWRDLDISEIPGWALNDGVCEGVTRSKAIDWVIVGGESGKNARPMHPDWARTLRDQCIAAGVPFHFKQSGEWRENRIRAGGDLGGDMRRGVVRIVHGPNGIDGHFRSGDVYMRRVGTRQAGRELDGRTWDEFPAARA